MARAFISYSRQSESIARTLTAHIKELGHSVWFDQELSGGQAWWDQILAEIRDCEVFVFILDPDALKSIACQSELRYADTLHKPVLPILVSDGVSLNLLPEELSNVQFVDYRKQDGAAALRLALAFSKIPPPQLLPQPLPQPPETPVSPLAAIRHQVSAPSILTDFQQNQMVAVLRTHLRDAVTGGDARILLETLRKRADLLATFAEEIDLLLSQPPPSAVKRGSKSTGQFPLKWLLVGVLILVPIAVLWLYVNSSEETGRYSAVEGLQAGSGLVRLTAVLAKGGPVVERPAWSVYETKPGPDGTPKKIVIGYDTEQQFTLPAGRYNFAVQAGAATGERGIDVRAGMLGISNIVLNAGIVDLTAALASGGLHVERPAWSVYGAKLDVQGNPRKISYGYDTKQRFTLPAGQYKVALQSGATVVEHEIDIKSGSRTTIEIALNAGIVDLTAVLASGGRRLSVRPGVFTGRSR